MNLEEKITIVSKKYNKKESLRCFFDKIILNNNEFLVLTTDNFKYIKNGKERSRGCRMDLIFFKDKWFNAFVFYKNGKKQKFYFNVASPANIEKNYIEYIDMDIDLVISSNFKTVEILDIEEFEVHKEIFKYSDFYIKNSLKAVVQIKELKNNKNFWELFK